ncbi:uncharacterized protein MKZ38_003045 [Zalerion maritima]|uniref:deoxyhypusine synthase n=1 Tax=Zalerion maritima TaxID=339359 RepID=A0AAD5RUP9_9PEZI|nr:uncharacterized protein MKZ38_003045 [Zalerion maritima]
MSSSQENSNGPPSAAKDAVLVPSVEMPAEAIEVSGIDFNKFHDKPVTAEDLYEGMKSAGFQSTSLCQAVDIINEMRTWAGPPLPDSPPGTSPPKCTIFLGYTSNLISSGLRSTLSYLVQHSHISAIVTTAGGIEEDIIKCLHPTYLSASGFSAPGASLRTQGLNRIGNLVVPNKNYCSFEDWVVPLLDEMLAEQETALSQPVEEGDARFTWTPSKVIHRLGSHLGTHPSTSPLAHTSVLYWAAKNNIPIFCPALTDGSLGDMLYFHTFRSSPRHLGIDIVPDIRRLNTISVRAAKAGMIILGGGLVKHHIANACLMRNGADYAVYINTAQEFDGSDAGARPDEAVSWGKIRGDAKTVKVYLEASVAFPLIVANTFVKGAREDKEDEKME